MNQVPTSLYIHIPWCVQKCPYCDFNSHEFKNGIPERAYIDCLVEDLSQDVQRFGQRQISSVFIGGGTPSLFSPEGIARLLNRVGSITPLIPNTEITLEANPGTLEVNKFVGFKQAGVNRISIGVQSFEQEKLSALGRIHNQQQALNAANFAREAQLSSFNLDLMHGLPNQTATQALHDLHTAISQNPPHISWYQLTIEPNTLFHSRPPTLPDEDELWTIQEQGHQALINAGYQQYEVSAYAKDGFQCQHNLNYWRFGDYFGIGCGAHGKLTQDGVIIRTTKIKHPKGYMDTSQPYLHDSRSVAPSDLPFEYLMNRFRLFEPCPKAPLEAMLNEAERVNLNEKMRSCALKGWIETSSTHWQVTPSGHRYLNSLLEVFLD